MRTAGGTIATLLLAAAAAVGQTWPQWRGPERDGVTGLPGPERWPAGLMEVWRAEVGTGHSSPLLSGGRVYLFTRLDDRETVSALDLASGELLWRQAYDAPYTPNMAAIAHGAGPKSTPVLAGGRLFTLGISGILAAWNAATGEPLWRHDFRDRFRATSPIYGTAASPLVDGDRLVAYVGGHDDGALAAFDAATGTELWAWTGDGPGYASPVVTELGGTRIVVTQSQQLFVGVDIATGELLWSRPFTTPWAQNSVTPLVDEGVVLVSGLGQGLSALRPVRGEGGWGLDRVWHNDEASLYMSSPIAAGDRVCGFSHLAKGRYFCLRAADGEILWTSDGRQGENAALLAAGSWMVALADGGELAVFAVDGGGEPVASYRVADSPTWAHPVLLADGLLVKDKTSLARLRFADRTPRPLPP